LAHAINKYVELMIYSVFYHQTTGNSMYSSVMPCNKNTHVGGKGSL